MLYEALQRRENIVKVEVIFILSPARQAFDESFPLEGLFSCFHVLYFTFLVIVELNNFFMKTTLP